MASINLVIRSDNKWTRVQRRHSDDLPSCVLGSAFWNTTTTDQEGGYYTTFQGQDYPVEFINDNWYSLEIRSNLYWTREDHLILVINDFGLGYWTTDDPQHPNYI